jgi:ribosomal protein S12 methylthiotransferase
MSEQIKIGFVSLGCAKNQVDSEVMLGALTRSGFNLTQEEDQAEVLIVNTCGFIDKAKQESIDTIIELGEYKKTGTCKVLIATGCLTERYRDELLKELPELDAIVGTGDFPKIADLCRLLLKQKNRSRSTPVQWTGSPTFLYGPETPRLRIGPRHWAYVKVSEGCHRTCSFCIIPGIRGGLQSRPVHSIVSEVEHLADEGVVEINLIAQDMSGYGMDWGRRGELIHLLQRLVKIGGMRWIRLLYLYPHRFPEGLMELMASEEKICKYVDLPIQHIDDDILRTMNRGGNSLEIFNLIDKLRWNIPGLVLRTTFIVGFPGETEKQFRKLYKFVQETQFDRVGVFTYSPEEGTAAYSLGDTVSEAVKRGRRDRLMRLQAEISIKKNSALIGTVQNVLVDGVSCESDLLLEGRTASHAPEIDGRIYINEGTARPGDFVQVEITQASHYDLVGRILTSSQFQPRCLSHPTRLPLHRV